MSFLRIEHMSPSELAAQYECYKKSIHKIRGQWNKLTSDAKVRAGKTLLNLRSQMDRIEILQMGRE